MSALPNSAPDAAGAPAPGRSLIACALLSAHVLLAEVALTRLLSVTLFYHYAFAIVALALAALGWGGRGFRPPAGEAGRRASLLDACSAAATSLLLYTILLMAVPWRPFVRLTEAPAREAVGAVARAAQQAGRWLAPIELVVLILLAALPFAFAGRALASLFAAARGRAAGLRAAEAAGGALAGFAAALAIGGLGAPAALVCAALAAALAGAVLARPGPEDAAAPGRRRRAAGIGAGAALLALAAGAGVLAPLPPLWALSRMRFGLREAAGALFVAALALVVELLGALPRPRRALRSALQAGGLTLLLLVQASSPLLRIRYVKGGYLEARPLREGWTLDARAALQSGNLYVDGPAKTNYAWGMSRAGFGAIVDQMQVQVDALSASPMVRFRGNLDELHFLRFDITSLPFHVLPPGADVLVVGAGGGRDLLAALVLGAGRVTGVESNPHVVRWVCEEYAAFTGRLCQNERVRMVRAEARAWLARSPERFDAIQVSFADSWAAGPAGAYALTENFLYTREALHSYLEHLEDGGLLSFSHYHPAGGAPTIERLFLTAVEVLEEMGSRDAGSHLFLATSAGGGSAAATLVVRRQPFPREVLERLASEAVQQDFVILYPRGDARGSAYADLLPVEGRSARVKARRADIRPVDDDRPFFFLTSRWWGPEVRGSAGGPLGFNDNAVAVLFPVALAGIGAALAGALLRPRRRASGGTRAAGHGPAVAPAAFFLLSGFAFVAAELGSSQRLGLVLGGPGTALTVALAALMASAAVGAVVAQRGGAGVPAPAGLRAAGLAAALVIAGSAAALPWLVGSGMRLAFPLRLAGALGILAPAGFFLGLLGAGGLRAAERGGESQLAQAWSASALGAAMAGAAGWWIAVWAGYGAVLLLGAAAAAATLAFAGSLGVHPGNGFVAPSQQKPMTRTGS